jgi:hypothetical protein
MYVIYTHYRMSEKSGTNGVDTTYANSHLQYVLHLSTVTLHTFSQVMYHVYLDSSQHIGMDSSTSLGSYLPKMTKISDFNSIHPCLQESPECKVQQVKVR